MSRAHTRFTALLLTTLVGLPAGCSTAPDADGSAAMSAPSPAGRVVAPRSGTRSVSESVGVVGDQTAESATLLTTQRLSAASRGRVGADSQEVIDAAPGEIREVKYSVRDAAAADVLRVLLGELLNRPYVLAPGVSGSITFDLDTRMTVGEIERFVGALASAFGWAIQDRDGVLVFSGTDSVFQSPDAKLLHGDAAVPGDAPAVRVFRFDHMTSSDAKSIVTELANKASAKAIPVGRYLVVAERTEQLARFASLFEALDAPAFDGVEIWTYELANLTPKRMVETLRTIGASSGMESETVAFLPLGDSDRMMVISKDPTVQPMVRRWISQLDQRSADQAVQRYIYNIQHYNPQELQTVLQQVFFGRAIIGGVAGEPGLMRLVFAAEAKQIVVEATPDQYTELASLLRVIDRPPQQVQLQTVIAEVVLQDSLEYGVQYFLTQDTGEGVLDLVGETIGVTQAVQTGAAVFTATDGFAIIRALDIESDVQVLSTPSVTVRDGIEATIQVGGETPVLQSVIDSGGQTGGNTDLRNEIVYRDTGIKLTVQPDINEIGFVTLKISQEVNDTVANTTSGIDSPEFTTRLIETEVVAPHGSTIMLGGIVETRRTQAIERVPILGEIPVLGALFSLDREIVDRTELIVTITPTIIDEPADASRLATDFMRAAQNVERVFESWPLVVPDALLETTRETEAVVPDATPSGEIEVPAADEDAGTPVAQGTPSVLGMMFRLMRVEGGPANARG